MGRFKTFANSGPLIPDDLNMLSSEIDASMSSWRTISQASVELYQSDIVGTKLFFLASVGAFETVRVGALWLVTATISIYINPQQLYRNRRGVMRLRASACANAVDNGVATMSIGVHSMVAFSVSPAGHPQLYFANEPLPGSVLDIGKVTAAAPVLATSASFPIPQPGHYGISYRASSNRNPNSNVQMSIQLQYRTSRL